MSDPMIPSEAGFIADPASQPASPVPPSEGHDPIFATTVCAIVEHGGELLMVRQLNRDGEVRWNFPTGWMAHQDEDGRLQLPEAVVNRNLLAETGYSASHATLIGMALVREHDDDGRRIGTSTRLDYLCSQPRQSSYAVNDPDILGTPEWFTPEQIDEMIERGEVKGQLTATAYHHWQEYRRSGRLSADLVDIPN